MCVAFVCVRQRGELRVVGVCVQRHARACVRERQPLNTHKTTPPHKKNTKRLLSGAGLRDYELALVANLAPETAHEAIALVPSLNVRSEE